MESPLDGWFWVGGAAAFTLIATTFSYLKTAYSQVINRVVVTITVIGYQADAVFHGRQNVAVSSGPGLTFDCLLNCLDGVQRSDGLLTIITTNHLDRIDPAIGQPGEIESRAGRIDRVVCLKGLDDAGRVKIAQRILKGWDEENVAVCRSGASDTPARFQERCARLAFALHYGDSTPGESILALPSPLEWPHGESISAEYHTHRMNPARKRRVPSRCERRRPVAKG